MGMRSVFALLAVWLGGMPLDNSAQCNADDGLCSDALDPGLGVLLEIMREKELEEYMPLFKAIAALILALALALALALIAVLYSRRRSGRRIAIGHPCVALPKDADNCAAKIETPLAKMDNREILAKMDKILAIVKPKTPLLPTPHTNGSGSERFVSMAARAPRMRMQDDESDESDGPLSLDPIPVSQIIEKAKKKAAAAEMMKAEEELLEWDPKYLEDDVMTAPVADGRRRRPASTAKPVVEDRPPFRTR